MTPFDVTYQAVPDELLSDLLAATNNIGAGTPLISPAASNTPRPMAALGHARTAPPDGPADLPDEWRLVREMQSQAYVWPESRDEYETYRIYAGVTAREGAVHIALGRAPRPNAWGRDRLYVVGFLSSGSPQIPLVEFLEADDFETTREFIAVIRGRDGGKKMYGPGDPLPAAYIDHFQTVLYRDRIDARGAWSKMAVVAREDDAAGMLNHALLQARRRGNL
jgi:hypothetical protein